MEKELVCIDTNICVDFLRAKGPGYALFIKLLEKYEPCVTAITAFELYLGHMKMKRRDKIADFIAQLSILPFDVKAAKVSAEIQDSLDKKGESIGIPDTLIAGICVAADIPLLTLNIRHFSRITELALIKNLS